MKWIPTSKAVPDKEGMYLTTTIFQEVYCDFWHGSNFDRTELVIAWAPMPEPYSYEAWSKNRDEDLSIG